MAFLYIVATPIGNLEDITLRALRILKEVDLILAEDTRVTKKLLNFYKIKTQVISYHQHSSAKRIQEIINLLKEEKNIALVSDAGTPGISDPGSKLIKKVIEELGFKVKIVPIPGPSALICAASVSGFPMSKFVFLGFPPTKKKRKNFFEKVISSKYPVIFYESPYRILNTLKELNQSYHLKRDNVNEVDQVVVCKELTKKFEKIYRGKIEEVIEEIKKDKIKGEFVVIVGK